MPDAYDDPHAVIEGWAERMKMRYGDNLWDQVRRQPLHWREALAKHVRRTSIVDGAYTWSDADVQAALRWEDNAHEYPENVDWPLWAQPWSKKDQLPCSVDDHKWSVIIEEGNLYLHCKDACKAGPGCTAVYRGGGGDPNASSSYDLGACVSVPDNWEDYKVAFNSEFDVRVSEYHEPGSWEDGYRDGYSEYHVVPVFATDSYICAHCGGEADKHKHAISRYEKGVRLCSDCGRKEAMKQYELRVEEDVKAMIELERTMEEA